MKPVRFPLAKMAKIMKALGHPLRLEIVMLIGRQGSMNVKQIHTRLKVSQPEASKQLCVLRRNSVLSCSRKNGYSYYRLDPRITFFESISNLTGKR